MFYPYNYYGNTHSLRSKGRENRISVILILYPYTKQIQKRNIQFDPVSDSICMDLIVFCLSLDWVKKYQVVFTKNLYIPRVPIANCYNIVCYVIVQESFIKIVASVHRAGVRSHRTRWCVPWVWLQSEVCSYLSKLTPTNGSRLSITPFQIRNISVRLVL